MLLRVNVAGAGIFDNKESLEKEINRLSNRDYMEARLLAIDDIKPIKRIYVMGCGRSGTWLLAAVMTTFKDVFLPPQELAAENFGLFSVSCSTLVMKRSYEAYKNIENIPAKIGIAYIVRHPFDVLTSYNPATKIRYHIKPHHWLGQMLALRYLVETGRGNTKIVRYEDLVENPEQTQVDLAAFFDLETEHSINEISETFNPNPATREAMHGLRNIDNKSVNKFKNDPKKIQYLHQIKPRLGHMLEWVAEEFNYDISLPHNTREINN